MYREVVAIDEKDKRLHKLMCIGDLGEYLLVLLPELGSAVRGIPAKDYRFVDEEIGDLLG